MVLIGLGQQRIMPMGLYAQDKACHAEEELIARHNDIPMDSKLVTVLQRQAATLMEGKMIIVHVGNVNQLYISYTDSKGLSQD